MADKKLSDMTDEEREALSEDEREELELAEEAEDEDGKGKGKGRLFDRFRATREQNRELQERLDAAERERDEIRMRSIAREEGGRREEVREDPDPVRPTPPAAFDFAAARRDKAAALKEGEFDKVEKIEEQIDAARAAQDEYRDKLDSWKDEINDRKIRRATATADERASRAEQTAISNAAADVIKEYPFLDISAKDADEDAIDAVKARRDRYIREGMNAADAIRKAGREIGKRFAQDDKPDDKNDKVSRAAEERTRGARERDRIPPNTGKGGSRTQIRDNDPGKADPSKLTDKEIAEMSPEEISRRYGAGARG